MASFHNDALQTLYSSVTERAERTRPHSPALSGIGRPEDRRRENVHLLARLSGIGKAQGNVAWPRRRACYRGCARGETT